MQRCIVVFLVGRQVDVFVLLAIVIWLLLIAVHVLAGTAHSVINELLLVLIAAIGVTLWRLLVILVQIVLHIIKNYCL